MKEQFKYFEALNHPAFIFEAGLFLIGRETYLRPALERLLPAMEISAFGCAARDAHIVFEPIAAIALTARAAILQQLSSSMISLYQSGLVSAEAALAELRSQGKTLGVFANLEPPRDASHSM